VPRQLNRGRIVSSTNAGTNGYLQAKNELIPFSGALVFAGAAKGHLYITWLWWPAGLMLTNPTGL